MKNSFIERILINTIVMENYINRFSRKTETVARSPALCREELLTF